MNVIVPDYGGGSLVNLVAEMEHRLTGVSASPRLHPALGGLIPDAETYVLVVFDGLGSHQLRHPRASLLAADVAASLDAPFPTTTTVSLATVATGLPPSRHGLLGYQLWIPDVGLPDEARRTQETRRTQTQRTQTQRTDPPRTDQQGAQPQRTGLVVNTIKWTTLWGEPVVLDTTPFLPSPNLWERLAAAGVDGVTVQPVAFESSPLTRLLYRGCRFEPTVSVADLVTATTQLAGSRRRLILTYVPHVDFAAHVFGQDSPQYGDAVSTADTVWSALRSAMPPGAVLLGTADHGHVDFPPDRQIRIDRADHTDRVFYGDGRAMFVRGEGASLAERLPATWVPLAEAADWWGPEPHHPAFETRRPDGILLADDGYLLLHRHSDHRMIGNHGGLTDAERLVPLLVGGDR